MEGHINGAWMTQMRLGSFKFSVYTAAYQSLDRNTDYKWGEQPLFKNYDDLQFLGPGADTIALQGVVFPEYKGGQSQIDELRSMAAMGRPALLISGLGKIFGYWVILSVAEGQTIFAAGGMPRRQEFTVTIKKHSDAKGKMSIIGLVKNAIGTL